MEVYQFLRRGEIHKDLCEDFLLASELNEQYSIYGVFDGCSSGIDSHFASTLLAKVVKAEMEYLLTEPVNSVKVLLANTIRNVMSTLRNIRNDLFLKTSELLSTLILYVVDNYSKRGEILVFGDGFVSINGKSVSIEQDNTPDYLAYHLDNLEYIEDFDSWLKEHSQQFTVYKSEDVSIATDGINSFQKTEFCANSIDEPVPADYLVKDNYLLHNKSMLARKCNILRTRYRLINQDDIALIRVVA